MQIALLGSAPSSVALGPFKDSKYREWVQGKTESMAMAHGQVPGDWDIWACSPGCWAVIPRATRFFEVHRWEPGRAWFSPEYCQFLRDFNGIVYTGAPIPELPSHVVYPIDVIEEKFSSYFLTSSLCLMLAMAIHTIEQIRIAREQIKVARAADLTDDGAGKNTDLYNPLPYGVHEAELSKLDTDDVIGMWGVDMSADEEWSYQRPGCQFFLLEAMRRGIGVYLPPESDLMRPMPVYGISEWDHNYIKLTQRAREMNTHKTAMAARITESQNRLLHIQGEQAGLTYFVNTWTSPYGMLPGTVVRQTPGTGLGSGITHLDGRPLMSKRVMMDAMSKPSPGEVTFVEDGPQSFDEELFGGKSGGGMTENILHATVPSSMTASEITEEVLRRQNAARKADGEDRT